MESLSGGDLPFRIGGVKDVKVVRLKLFFRRKGGERVEKEWRKGVGLPDYCNSRHLRGYISALLFSAMMFDSPAVL